MVQIKHFCNICECIATSLLHLVAAPPLQNRFFHTRQDAQQFATTEVDFLWCETCQHISISKTRSVEFDQHYDNRQTASQFAVDQYKSVIGDIEQQVPSREACIVEIGCGRGELLEMLHSSRYKNLKGYDPAAPAATDLVSNVYWNGSTQGNGADLILARHTIEEVPEPNGFIGFMAKSLNQDGRIYCEITNAPKLLSYKGIFSLYPECSNLFSALSLAKLYARNGLFVEKITSINDGEWLGVWGKKSVSLDGDSAASFLSSVYKKLLQLPRPIVIWGAGGRGGNILSFLDIGLAQIEFVVDLNPAKQGLFIPPFGQKVISPDQLLDVNPRTILVASYKYKSEISKMAPAECRVIAIDDL